MYGRFLTVNDVQQCVVVSNGSIFCGEKPAIKINNLVVPHRLIIICLSFIHYLFLLLNGVDSPCPVLQTQVLVLVLDSKVLVLVLVGYCTRRLFWHTKPCMEAHHATTVR